MNSYTYSDRGRLSSVTTAGGTVNYRFNAFEQRVYKSGPASLIPTGAAYYVHDSSGKLLGEYAADGTPIYETVYLGSSPVNVLKQTGTAQSGNIATGIYNVYADHLATPRVITRSSDEAIVWRWDTAEAFGATAPDQNPNGLGTFVFNQRFAGQVYDYETGLFDNWHRTYSARQGRYLESDPIGLAGGSWSTFTYVGGNPLSFVDPTGLLCPMCVGAAIGGVIGGGGCLLSGCTPAQTVTATAIGAVGGAVGAFPTAGLTGTVIAGATGGSIGNAATSVAQGEAPSIRDLVIGLVGGGVGNVAGEVLNAATGSELASQGLPNYLTGAGGWLDTITQRARDAFNPEKYKTPAVKPTGGMCPVSPLPSGPDFW